MPVGDKLLRIDYFTYAFREGNMDVSYAYSFALADPADEEEKRNSLTIGKEWLLANLTQAENDALLGLRAKLLAYVKTNVPRMSGASEKADP